MTPVGLAFLLLTACERAGDGDTAPHTTDDLRDPQTCATCHPKHFQEWSGSMHAYAGIDPIFLAMDARGQRETDGALGDFCVDCHAPLASAEGLVSQASDIADLPAMYQGITCYFCHQVTDVQGDSNNPTVLAMDSTFRGSYGDALETDAHESAYSPYQDRSSPSSSKLCGSCHDIVTPNGTYLERTYGEWLASPYAEDDSMVNCSMCHMDVDFGQAAEVDGAPTRSVHSHRWPGVDTAIVPFPDTEAQAAAVQAELDQTLTASLCVNHSASTDDTTVVEVTLANTGAGHNWPSGASADRRAWVELVASEGDEVVWSTGVVEDDEALTSLDDPDLWSFFDTLTDDDGHEVHMFWEATEVASNLIPPTGPLSSGDVAVEKTYTVPSGSVSGIEMRVRIRSMGLDILDDLVASGDLDPAYRNALPTYDLEPTVLVWSEDVASSEDGRSCVE